MNTYKHDNVNDIYIVNNYKKYYLYIHKNILYFYPSDESKKYYKNNLLKKNVVSDFFLECDINNLLKEQNYLFEGYMYGDNDNCKELLLTDILFCGNTLIVDSEYSTRYTLLYNIFNTTSFNFIRINNSVSIKLHPYTSEKMLKTFLNNFKWCKEVISIERISNFSKQQYIITGNSSSKYNSQPTLKIVKKTSKSEIYQVYDTLTNDNEGLLYVKSLYISKKLDELFKNNPILELNCVYNFNFQKWMYT